MRDQKATTQANGPKFLNIKDGDQLDISPGLLPDARIANVGMDPDSALLSELDRSYNLDDSLEKQLKKKSAKSSQKRVSYL